MNVTAPEPSVRNADTGDKIALLSRPSTYGPAVTAVERIETHMSLVFLTDPFVYKLKKPVVYPFLDFGTPAVRERSCREEIRLNRRLAPDVYLGLSKITRRNDGTLALDGEGEVVDWLVRMRRLPRERLLDHRIAEGTVTPAQIEPLAEVLARFYGALPPSRLSADQVLDQLISEHQVNRSVLKGFEPQSSEPLLAEVQRFLDCDADLLRARVAAGRIVDGHGDLRPEHVCLNTPPVVIDCLEFNERLRQVDPFDEITFLGLDCARLGAPWIGPLLLQRLRASLGDDIDPRLLRFYAHYRACIRARLALSHLAEPSPREADRWQPLARTYLRLGREFNPTPSTP